MIKFISDRKTRSDGTLEPCLLAGYRTAPLIIRTLEGERIAEILPSSPWTHEKLLELGPGLEVMFSEQIKKGVDAYLGKQWVGSTEI